MGISGETLVTTVPALRGVTLTSAHTTTQRETHAPALKMCTGSHLKPLLPDSTMDAVSI